MTKTKNPAAVALGRLGGNAKSAAKAAAVRRNGRKGGRPRKHADVPAEILDALVQGWRDGLIDLAAVAFQRFSRTPTPFDVTTMIQRNDPQPIDPTRTETPNV